MSTTDIKPGDEIRLGRHGNPDTWWKVRAVGGHFAVATTDIPDGSRWYTAIDFERDVRGPINLIGGGYGNGIYDDGECDLMLRELIAGDLEVTWRRPAPLRILERRSRA